MAEPSSDGTARRIGPIADEVLAWVARKRHLRDTPQTYHRFPVKVMGIPNDDDLRRIELCALAAKEASMFFDFYGIDAPLIYDKETC